MQREGFQNLHSSTVVGTVNLLWGTGSVVYKGEMRHVYNILFEKPEVEDVHAAQTTSWQCAMVHTTKNNVFPRRPTSCEFGT